MGGVRPFEWRISDSRKTWGLRLWALLVAKDYRGAWGVYWLWPRPAGAIVSRDADGRWHWFKTLAHLSALDRG